MEISKEERLLKFKREHLENRKKYLKEYHAMNYKRKPKSHTHCLLCKKRISVYRQATAKYCSKKCSYKATSRKHNEKYNVSGGKDYRGLIITFLGSKCINCEAKDKLQIDHKIPRHLGGENIMENIQILCILCHKKKTAKEMADFNQKMYPKNTLKTKAQKRRKKPISRLNDRPEKKVSKTI